MGGLGAKYVLRSLTDNHRNLYRELLIAQLDKMEKAIPSASGRVGLKGNAKVAVDLKAYTIHVWTSSLLPTR